MFLHVFSKLIAKQIGCSLRQWSVFTLLCLFAAMSWLFFSFCFGYRELFVNQLRDIFPPVFIETRGAANGLSQLGWQLHEEVFEVSQTLRFKLEENGCLFTIGDVGIRGIHPEAGSASWHGQWARPTRGIRVNQAFSDLLGHRPERLFFEVKEGFWQSMPIAFFSSASTKPWLVMPVENARQLGFLPNIATIYSGDHPETIRTSYARQNVDVHFWKERVPFVSRIRYHLSWQLFSVVVLGMAVLCWTLIGCVLRDLMLEFRGFIHLAKLYGTPPLKLSAGFQGLTLAYGAVALLTTALLIRLVSATLTAASPKLGHILAAASMPAWQYGGILCLSTALLIPLYVQHTRFPLSED